MELYRNYQPVTWNIGVIEAAPEDVARVIQPLYIPNDVLRDIRHETLSIDEGLAGMEPLGRLSKFLLIETKDGRTGLFGNSLNPGGIELPTWYAADSLGVPSSHYVCNAPNTISKDQMSGSWGARMVEFRTPEHPYNQEPTFGVNLVNDAGRWHFYRFGEKQPFENEKAYKARRKPDRFTVEMLVKYCRALGIPVYDRDWYSNNVIIIERISPVDAKGLTYHEAAIELRIDQIETSRSV